MVGMVIKKQDGRYYKNCSNCGEEQSYLRKYYAEESLRLNKHCKKCSNKNPNNNQHQGYYKEVLRKSFVHKYKANAELRNISWEVSFEYLAELLIKQKFKCTLTGIFLDAMKVNNNCSLDRIDSKQGYTKDNVQWVIPMVNMCKQAYTQEDFIEMCKNVALNNK